MKIGILLCDNVRSTLSEEYGEYSDMIKKAVFEIDENATFEVYQADETTIADTVLTGYVVKVTSEDNSANKTYTITVNDASVAPVVFISEVADPADNYKARFVELYNAGNEAVDLSANIGPT